MGATYSKALKKENELNMWITNLRLGDKEKVLAVLKKDRTLSIWSAKLEDKGTKALADLLKENRQVQVLSLWWNNIGDEGAKAAMLKVNDCLREVDLWVTG